MRLGALALLAGVMACGPSEINLGGEKTGNLAAVQSDFNERCWADGPSADFGDLVQRRDNLLGIVGTRPNGVNYQTQWFCSPDGCGDVKGTATFRTFLQIDGKVYKVYLPKS